MTEQPDALVPVPEGYGEWLADLKTRVRAAQQRAALAVNTEQMSLYWEVGRAIDARVSQDRWGAKVIQRLAHDLRTSFPDMRGFSFTNLRYMRSFAQAWPDEDLPTAVGRLPWGHNLVLLARLKERDGRLAYAAAAVEHGWSRSVLEMHIDARTLERKGRAVTNFERTLPAPHSDLARESLKDPYLFDFLGLGNDAQERAIEQALVDHVTEFLVELGAGFAYVGRQVHLEVGGEDFYLDLLFYHLKLRCFVVIELKATAFKPEHLGQLGFYLAAVDGEVKHPDDGPTVGLLLCRTKNEVVAEYALRNVAAPLGVSEYELLKDLPEPLATNLPTIEQIERELQDGGDR
ncbi:PDDEXK nuclease domain-containing protein [Luteimicrobium subarcticum]|uniref:Putative nuclease of restriction endonuclease-like (RecB) superfamily n=1 Tax=Luteimicrobium subarcticum TaxID=620910 RepID=A0A2M8W6Y1_9MICO|nr:PDDEXK nuclease domain-containing protein [Luteimicrobium subarcticum]PJI86652.1 putative nuclease of restriction endonuclease-like (RecB) superfamily [Luteimicrobium subarcticum]